MEANQELPEELQTLNRIRNDPWEFLKCVYTKDEVDPKTPIKRFPVHLQYLHYYTRVWEKERALAVPKSRRMKMSWINVCLFTWENMFHIGGRTAFVSKKEDGANDLVKRAGFISSNLDKTRLPKELIPKFILSKGKLEFPELESAIEAYPSGADQLRQFTFRGILVDEHVFLANAEEMFGASMPTLEGGGRFVSLSSVGPGFFRKLVFDKLDEDDEEDVTIA